MECVSFFLEPQNWTEIHIMVNKDQPPTFESIKNEKKHFKSTLNYDLRILSLSALLNLIGHTTIKSGICTVRLRCNNVNNRKLELHSKLNNGWGWLWRLNENMTLPKRVTRHCVVMASLPSTQIKTQIFIANSPRFFEENSKPSR